MKLDQAQVELLYQQGLNIHKIAAQLGCTPNAVWKRLVKGGVQRTQAVWSPSNDQELIRKYQTEGLGYRRCAANGKMAPTKKPHAGMAQLADAYV